MEAACSLRMYIVRRYSWSLIFDMLKQVTGHFGNIGNKFGAWILQSMSVWLILVYKLGVSYYQWWSDVWNACIYLLWYVDNSTHVRRKIYGCLLLSNNITVNFPGGSVVKNLPAMQEMWVWSLGQEDPLEKEVATHSGILAWRIPWT